MKYILLALIIGVTTVANAQRLKLGVKGGVNFASLQGDRADELNLEGRTGYHIGAVGTIKLTRSLAIQPEILYSTQGAKLDNADFEVDYINIPVLAKFTFAKIISVQAGPQFGFLVNNGENINADDFDPNIVIGAGVEVGPLFAQLRYTTGVTVKVDDEVQNAIGDVHNSVFQLSVGYYIF